MIEKLSADEKYAYGRIAARGFIDKLTKLSSGEDTEGAGVSSSDKRTQKKNA